MTSRRAFLKSGALAVFGVGFGGVPSFVARAAAIAKSPGLYRKNKTLVCIFQRGAMDGLMAVSPFTDEYLKAARPSLFMSAANAVRTKPLIDLDGKFGLHPGFAAFQPFFQQKQLAIVHGIGSPNNSRSHFDAQDYMESGTPFTKGTNTGWLNRACGLLGTVASPFRAVSVTNSMPRSFYGPNEALAISDIRDFALKVKGNPATANLTAKSFEDLYDQASADLLKETGKETFSAVKMLEKLDTANYQPANGAVYPNTALGNALRQIAQLVKMDVGLEIGFAESGGWDTHYNQGTDTGIFARNAQDLGNSIAAFWIDLSAHQDDVTLMTMTEFGRTVKQNGSGGTDHGRGSCNFILGNDVAGGVVYGDLKPLALENLEDGRDVPVTTDFRSVFSEVADSHLKINNNKELFPGWEGSRVKLMRS